MKIGLTAVVLAGVLASGVAVADVPHDGNYLLANCTIAKKYLDGATAFSAGENVTLGM